MPVCHAAVLAACLLAPALPSQAGDAEAAFHRAYYLEVEEGKLEAAIPLYEQAAQAPGAPPRLAEDARRRLAGCREGVRARDLARLAPPDSLLYVELRRPGEHLARLLRLAGLTPAPGGGGQETPPFQVSPRLLEAMKDVEGAALAITEFDPRRPPRGLLVVHSGRADLLHGLVETALSGAAASGEVVRSEPVGGHPSYLTPLGTVVVTGRLILAADSRERAQAAVERLEKEDAESLARTPRFAGLEARREGSLLFAVLDGPGLVDSLRPHLERGGQVTDEMRLVELLADVESLERAVLRAGVAERSVEARLWLDLKEENRARAYHLVRTPPLRKEALGGVPGGAAAFLALALSARPGDGAGEDRAAAAAAVTGLEIGRELFANIGAVAAFVLPGSPVPGNHEGPPMPEVGLVLQVEDAARSKARWSELLGLPAAIEGRAPPGGREAVVAGKEARVFQLGPMLIYLASLPGRTVLGTSPRVLEQVFAAVEGKGSVLQDAAFSGVLSVLPADPSKAVVLHAGRLWQVAEPYLHSPPPEAREMALLLKDAALTLVTRESPARLEVSLSADVPDLGPLLRKFTEGDGLRAGPAADAGNGRVEVPVKPRREPRNQGPRPKPGRRAKGPPQPATDGPAEERAEPEPPAKP